MKALVLKPSVVRLLAILLVLVSTAGCDQATKQLARAELSPMSSTIIAGGLIEFTLAENPGAFLSLGTSLPSAIRDGVFTLGVGLGLVFLLGYLLKTAALHWLSFLALALIWAGGMSNLLERLFRGGLVTDFIVFRAGTLHTGIFNMADLAIVCGLSLLVSSLGAPRCRATGRDEVSPPA